MFYSIENSSSFSRGPWGIFPQTFGFRGALLVVHSCYYATLVLPFPSLPPALPPPAITPHTTVLALAHTHVLSLVLALAPKLAPALAPQPGPAHAPALSSAPPYKPLHCYITYPHTASYSCHCTCPQHVPCTCPALVIHFSHSLIFTHKTSSLPDRMGSLALHCL
jgi:hypothetical protein